MTFTKIGLTLDTCNCLSFESQDLTLYYARRIARPLVVEKDFLTKYEKNPTVFAIDTDKDCFKWCHNITSISINEWNECHKTAIINKYLDLFDQSKQQRRDAILIFKLTEKAGKIKTTPRDDDATHRDFYKSDNFTITTIEVIDILELSEYL
jgi:hypothetical protein